MTASTNTDGRVASATENERGPRRSAAAPSPFTPIAQYGFLSNCHTGALVAPDGSVDWLCVPRFDSPSVFGALLDRGAGSFRFGPFGINVPSDRIYEPGTNTIVTSWKTPTGWVVVRDALTIGPRRGEDTVTPHTRPPFDQDADHALVRTASCIDGTVEIDLVCEPAFDYGRIPAEWTLSADRQSRRGERGRAGAAAADRHAASASKPGGLEPAASSAPARRSTARSPGARMHWSRRPSRRRARSSRPRRCSGATGSRARRSPTTSWGR